jgi:hypothetical protein
MGSEPECVSPRISPLHTLTASLVKGKQVPKRLVYTLPFTDWVGGTSLMGFVNVPVVQRSWGLNQLRYETLAVSSSPHAREEDKLVPYAGPNFTYEEFGRTRKFGELGALIWSIGVAVVFGIVALIPPVVWLVRKFGPAPGTGPSDECVVGCRWFTCRF